MVRRGKLAQHRDAVAAIVRTAKAEETCLLDFAGNALLAIDGRVELLEIMAFRLTEANLARDTLSRLIGVFDGVTGWGGGFTDPAELPHVADAWRAFIAAHRSELEAGKRFSLEDPAVTPDLVPHGWKLNRTGKPDWPPR